MKQSSLFRKLLLVVALLLACVLLVSHTWLRSRRFTVTENGKVVPNAQVYEWIGGDAYITLPEWTNESYIIDFRDKAVFVPMAHQALANRACLLTTRWRIDAVYFGKLEREMPIFEGDSVTLTSNNGAHIVIRR